MTNLQAAVESYKLLVLKDLILDGELLISQSTMDDARSTILKLNSEKEDNNIKIRNVVDQIKHFDVYNEVIFK
jgi:hypothetical protein